MNLGSLINNRWNDRQTDHKAEKFHEKKEKPEHARSILATLLEAI
jgi:hypothetical protein